VIHFHNGAIKLKNIIKSLWILNGQDGVNNQLYIVQARPETVHGKDKNKCARFINSKKRILITQGIALGDKIATGKARILNSPQENQLLEGNSCYRFNKS
jgi:pyruvate,water dikinase